MIGGGVRGRSKGVQLLCSDEADGLKVMKREQSHLRAHAG